MSEHSATILCTACGEEALVRREPVYEGFTKTGERVFCALCGHEFAEGEIPYREKKTPSVFSQEDRGVIVDVFRNDEKGRNCRHCSHYVVNPFLQRCGRHHKEVQATDTCGDFEPISDAPAGK